ncbi:MAG: class I SAM-dependent methyltransferase [Halobacteriales archaeon]
MRRACVRVDRTEGEATRRALEAAGVRDPAFAIDSDAEHVYIPVVDPEAVPAAYPVVQHDVAKREGQTLPADLLGYSPTYERLGGLVLLQEDDPERARAAAEAFMAADLPVEAVLNKRSAVAGTERIAEWELLAGGSTETVHTEYGATFRVDPTKAYFSPRLATERERVVAQVDPGERVFDMFAGVGPYAIRAALAGAEVVAVDVNPDAATYCRENAERNGVADRVTVLEGDVREHVDEYPDWADRVVMNLPHSADRFLDAARTVAAGTCRLHYYDIQPEAEAFDPGESAIEAAFARTHRIRVATRRVVRTYAPGVLNVCLDVDVVRT